MLLLGNSTTKVSNSTYNSNYACYYSDKHNEHIPVLLVHIGGECFHLPAYHIRTPRLSLHSAALAPLPSHQCPHQRSFQPSPHPQPAFWPSPALTQASAPRSTALTQSPHRWLAPASFWPLLQPGSLQPSPQPGSLQPLASLFAQPSTSLSTRSTWPSLHSTFVRALLNDEPLHASEGRGHDRSAHTSTCSDLRQGDTFGRMQQEAGVLRVRCTGHMQGTSHRCMRTRHGPRFQASMSAQAHHLRSPLRIVAKLMSMYSACRAHAQVGEAITARDACQGTQQRSACGRRQEFRRVVSGGQWVGEVLCACVRHLVPSVAPSASSRQVKRLSCPSV